MLIAIIRIAQRYTSRIDWKVNALTVAVCYPISIIWGLIHIHYDKEFPAWMMHPHTALSIPWKLMSPEDWVFYLIAGAFFLVIVDVVSWFRYKCPSTYCAKKMFLSTTIFINTFWVAIFIKYGGISSVISYLGLLLPGYVLIVYNKKAFSISNFLKVMLLVMGVAAIWDLAAVTWIPAICSHIFNQPPEMFEHWFYIAIDDHGITHHSKIYIDYNKHGWAWIGRNPISITFYFGYCGAFLIYGVREFFLVRLADTKIN